MKTDAEISPAIVSGIVTGDAPFSYWPIFSLSQGKSLWIPWSPCYFEFKFAKKYYYGILLILHSKNVKYMISNCFKLNKTANKWIFLYHVYLQQTRFRHIDFSMKTRSRRNSRTIGALASTCGFTKLMTVQCALIGNPLSSHTRCQSY